MGKVITLLMVNNLIMPLPKTVKENDLVSSLNDRQISNPFSRTKM